MLVLSITSSQVYQAERTKTGAQGFVSEDAHFEHTGFNVRFCFKYLVMRVLLQISSSLGDREQLQSWLKGRGNHLCVFLRDREQEL